MPKPSVISARLKALREAKSWTVADLARASGVDRSAISQVENGNSTSPSFANGVRLSVALDVAPEYLAGLIDEARPYGSGLPEGEISGPGGLRIRRIGAEVDVIPAPGQILYGGDITELAEGMADVMLPMIAQILRRRASGDPKRLSLVDQLFGPEKQGRDS